ncbi:MAG: hypothetical protein NXI31_01920 [bacterium]|nr:hypothetical protein [bacterium]
MLRSVRPAGAMIAGLLSIATIGAQDAPVMWAEAPPEWVEPARAAAFAGFVASHGPHRARWCRATGTPSEVFGRGLKVDAAAVSGPEAAQGAALAALAEHAALLAHEDDVWVPRIARRVGPLFMLVFDQQRNGLPVVGGRADVRIHVKGRISMLGAKSFAIDPASKPLPAITAQDAAMAACAALEVRSLRPAMIALQPPPHRLVYWANAHAEVASSAHLCWEVTIDALAEKIVGRAYVDARTGELHGYETDLSYCSSGHTHVRGFHPGLSRRLEVADHFGDDASASNATRAPATAAVSVPVPIIGNVNAVIPINHDPGDLTNSTTRTNTLQVVPLRGVRVRVPSTGAFAYTDASGAFSIPHPSGTAVPIEVKLLDAERYRAILPHRGAALTATPTVTPGVSFTVNLGAIASITEDDLSQTTTAYYLDSVSRYLEGIVGPLPARTFNLLGAVNSPQVCNAFYSAHSDAMTFFASPQSQNIQTNSTTVPCNAFTNSAYSNIIQHEYGHLLDDVFGGESFYEGLSEGWGDIIGMYHVGREFVNEQFYNSMALPAHDWARSGNNTQQWDNWAAMGQTGCDYPTGATPAAMEVHCQGESWMGFAWKVRSNFIASVGSSQQNAFPTAAAAIAHAESIVIGSIVANAADQNGAVLQVYLLDDDDGDLTNGAPHSFWMNPAATAHGLTVPTSNNGVTGFTPYGTGCQAFANLQIDVAAQPRIGRQLVLIGRNAPAFAPAVAAIGTSNASANGVPLPLDLTPYGAPGCDLLCSVDLVLPGQTDAQGTSLAGWVIPFDPALVGASFFCQWLIADPTANAAGFVMGQAARGVVSQ